MTYESYDFRVEVDAVAPPAGEVAEPERMLPGLGAAAGADRSAD